MPLASIRSLAMPGLAGTPKDKKYRTRLYEAQLSFNHGLKPLLISALLHRVVRSQIIF